MNARTDLAPVGGPAGRPHTLETARARAAAGSVAFTAGVAFVCARSTGSDGRAAAALDVVNLAWFAAFAWKLGDRALWKLLAAAAVFGATELLADFLCVRCTGTLDYSVARSALLLESPWWMPASWAVVAVQVGVGGDAAIRGCGPVHGALLTGALAAILIPFYEQMAWGANWWRYRGCLLLGHAPVYIVVAEAAIGVGLAWLGHLALRACSWRAAVPLGLAGGLVTILGGAAGWGSVEFLCRGARPAWPF